MKVCVVVLCLLVAAWGQEHCCGPNAFEGFIHDYHVEATGREYGVTNGWASMHYDYNTRRFAFTHEVIRVNPGGPTHVVKYEIIDNFDTKRRVFVQNDTCVISALEGTMVRPCVAEEAEFDERYHVGMGENSLEVLGYRLQHGNFMTHFGRTADGCYPFSFSESILRPTADDPSQLNYGQYVDITEGIKDNSVFDTPAICLTRLVSYDDNFDLPPHAAAIEKLFVQN